MVSALEQIWLVRDCTGGSRSSPAPTGPGGGSSGEIWAHLTHCWGSGKTPRRENGEKEQRPRARAWSRQVCRGRASRWGLRTWWEDRLYQEQPEVLSVKVTGSDLSYLTLVETYIHMGRTEEKKDVCRGA